MATALVASLVLMLTVASGAQASEHSFCSGVWLAGYNQQQCPSGYWNMNSGYASSLEGGACIQLLAGGNYLTCSNAANQGAYINQGFCGYGRALVSNPTSHYEHVYGTFWTC